MNDEDLDLLSSIWIMACNDDRHLISYEGIQHRLSLPPEFDVKSLIKKRPELFRRGASKLTIDEWKEKLLQGKSVPAWIQSLPEEERVRKISGLSSDDFFRSQFRAHRASERSPIEIINWGLEHLNRLRKAKLETLEATAKSWQMWLTVAVGVANIFVSFILKYAVK